MTQVLCIGISVVDFVFQVDALPRGEGKFATYSAEIVGGGCAANAAVAIARLGGAPMLATRIASDPIGDMILADLEREGVNCTLTQPAQDGRSSYSSVYVDATGERQIMNYRGAGLSDQVDQIAAVRDTHAVLADTRWVAGGRAGLRLAKERGLPGVLDGEAPVDAELVGLASHAVFSQNGLSKFSGQSDVETGLRRVAERTDAWVGATTGQGGTYWLEGDRLCHSPAFEVPVVDTLGAGDVWHGAFALALGERKCERDAVHFASAVAALKCRAFGGRKATPNLDDTLQFLSQQKVEA